MDTENEIEELVRKSFTSIALTGLLALQPKEFTDLLLDVWSKDQIESVERLVTLSKTAPNYEYTAADELRSQMLQDNSIERITEELRAEIDEAREGLEKLKEENQDDI